MKTLSGFFAVLLAASGSPSLASDLTGNWAVKEALGDGTVRATYLNLKQEGAHITGAIRATQFYYRIVESTGGPDGFTLTGSMMDGNSERHVKDEGKLVGEELHLAGQRRPDAPEVEMRSGEHTSELQSQLHIRYRPLLGKKNRSVDAIV